MLGGRPKRARHRSACGPLALCRTVPARCRISLGHDLPASAPRPSTSICTRGRADPAHRVPVQRRRHAAAGELAAVDWRDRTIGLLDAHLTPVNVEFLGDQHRQHGLEPCPISGFFDMMVTILSGATLHIGVERHRRLGAGHAAALAKPGSAEGQQQTAAGGARSLSENRGARACRRCHRIQRVAEKMFMQHDQAPFRVSARAPSESSLQRPA